MNEYIKSDLFRYKGNATKRSFFFLYRSNPVFRFQCALRLCNSKGFAKLLGNILWKLSRTKRIIQIPKHTNIGFGLYIGHLAPIVVNESAVIGNNCNISHFVSIGSNFGKAARIGDNVYIGPNVCIIENIKIGNNVTIGAGSIVTKDIPENATACGNYAKVINYNNPGRYIKNRWIIND